MRKVFVILLYLISAVLPSSAQHDCGGFLSPFDFGLFLSGNFGELRSNHFHSGIDFKTQGVVGKPIRCLVVTVRLCMCSTTMGI